MDLSARLATMPLVAVAFARYLDYRNKTGLSQWLHAERSLANYLKIVVKHSTNAQAAEIFDFPGQSMRECDHDDAHLPILHHD